MDGCRSIIEKIDRQRRQRMVQTDGFEQQANTRGEYGTSGFVILQKFYETTPGTSPARN